MAKSYGMYVNKSKQVHGDRGLDNPDPLAIILPDYLADIVILDEIFVHNNDDVRILAFCSEFGLQLLSEHSDCISVDGTFMSAPKNYAQFFTIAVIIDHHAIPVLFSLMPCRTEIAYNRLYNSLIDRMPNNWSPTNVLCDFEIASINSIKRCFPLCSVHGCNFHYGQTLHRWMRGHCPDISYRFDHNDDIRMAIKSLHSLSFVPIANVYCYFCKIMGQFENSPEVRTLIMYFVKTWIGPSYIHHNIFVLHGDDLAVHEYIVGQIVLNAWEQRSALFPFDLWNVCTLLHEGNCRTNNSLEAFFSCLEFLFKPNPPLSKLIRRVIKEFKRWKTVVEDYNLNPGAGIRGGLTRKRKWRRQDQDLLIYLQNIFAKIDQIRSKKYSMSKQKIKIFP
jgi:hypothetical protein